MPMQIKTDYINPLTMIEGKGTGPTARQIPTGQKASDKVKELQAKHQQLQNEILLRKSTGSNSGGISPDQQKAMEEKLEQLSIALRAARRDLYEKEPEILESPGLYQIKPKQRNSYGVSFEPYCEKK